eukprot:TRINITY_DN16350_c0_g2_i1.p1 TRINITY_DN16350_c0_g2~~TRINITY_DN16350_c0_g2_i1.p1  ORF type:complete len:279 (+),score=48.92 TRINITY_DN16350_c0_g2_i1:246-1082(+)
MPKSTATAKIHIPGFGFWNTEKDVVISEYFDIARQKRLEGKVNSEGAKKAHFRHHGRRVRSAEPQTRERISDFRERGAKTVPKSLDSSPIRMKGGPIHGMVMPSKTSNSAPLSVQNNRKRHQHYQQQYDMYQDMQTENLTNITHKRPPSASTIRSSVPAPGEVGGSRTPSPPVRSRAESNAKKLKVNKKSVPKLGAWDVSDPTTWPEITEVFDEVRSERQGGSPIANHRRTTTATKERFIVPNRVEEDLYKPTSFHKKRGDKLFSYLSNLCGGITVCN